MIIDKVKLTSNRVVWYRDHHSHPHSPIPRHIETRTEKKRKKVNEGVNKNRGEL